MGDFSVRKINNAEERRKMYQHALADIKAFEQMLADQQFDTSPAKIGAEQELCIVDKHQQPARSALQLLDTINDPHYTNELGLFNMEINLDPLLLSGSCFSTMETALLDLLKKGQQAARDVEENILLAGILPTLKYHHLGFDYMTPVERYRTLSAALSNIRGANFEIYLQGVDDLMLSLGSVLFEACNTSFQLHLQIHPDEFVDRHNWAQMISGPVLSACVNSPLLFGNELWAETRIALFKQSLDTRSSQRFLRKKLPRVYFGDSWLQHSAAELWKKDLMRFPLLVTSDDLEDAPQMLREGRTPNLRGIRLHNGTTYTWNRLCYGFPKGNPHLRIECRYLPAGPSAADEIANFAFWIGLMNSEPIGGTKFWKKADFKAAKNNFIKAARTGLQSVFQWFGKSVPAQTLILNQLLPMARQGLQASGVAAADIEHYLGIIGRRVSAETTGSEWMVQNFRTLSQRYSPAIAQRELVRLMLDHQDQNLPVHQWENIDPKVYTLAGQTLTVEQLMSTDVLSVNENDSLELVEHILDWKKIHHLPIETTNGDLVGLITDGMIERLKTSTEQCHYAKDVMLKQLYTIDPQASIEQAQQIMIEYRLSGLPVVYQNKLVGIITQRDLDRVEEVRPKKAYEYHEENQWMY
ncbi:MAG: CBS domain-containing protein [Bacteroidota bacterium]